MIKKYIVCVLSVLAGYLLKILVLIQIAFWTIFVVPIDLICPRINKKIIKFLYKETIMAMKLFNASEEDMAKIRKAYVKIKRIVLN